MQMGQKHSEPMLDAFGYPIRASPNVASPISANSPAGSRRNSRPTVDKFLPSQQLDNPSALRESRDGRVPAPMGTTKIPDGFSFGSTMNFIFAFNDLQMEKAAPGMIRESTLDMNHSVIKMPGPSVAPTRQVAEEIAKREGMYVDTWTIPEVMFGVPKYPRVNEVNKSMSASQISVATTPKEPKPATKRLPKFIEQHVEAFAREFGLPDNLDYQDIFRSQTQFDRNPRLHHLV